MNISELILQQRKREDKTLKLLLIGSTIGSLAFHAGAMNWQPDNLLRQVSSSSEVNENEIEVAVQEPLVEKLPEQQPTEVASPLLPQEVVFTPEPPPLASSTQVPLSVGQDAPTKETAALSNDPVAPMTNQTGNIPATKAGLGTIFSPNGKGTGFGNAKQPTGFVRSGKPEGKLQGKPSTEVQQTSALPSPPIPIVPPQLQTVPQPVCLSCPKPKYQGTEASPRVEMRIRPDGTVEVQLRQSSGNPEVDRATLEAMSKWQFDPKTIPESGVRKRIRITYEEVGSNFQRDNEVRRQQEAERRRLAEEEQQRIEAQKRSPSPVETTPSAKTNPASTPDSSSNNLPTLTKPVIPTEVRNQPSLPVETAPSAQTIPSPTPDSSSNSSPTVANPVLLPPPPVDSNPVLPPPPPVSDTPTPVTK